MGNPSTASKIDEIAAGDVVRWITDARAVWREEYGDGPFTVIAANPLTRSHIPYMSTTPGTIEMDYFCELSFDEGSWMQYDGQELSLAGPDGARVPVTFHSSWFVRTTVST